MVEPARGARPRTWALLLALGAGACGAPAPADEPPDAWVAGALGASLARLGPELLVVDPDADRIALVDPETLEPRGAIDVGDEPRTLLPLADGTLLVALHAGGELAVVDVASRQVVARHAGCAGAFGLAAEPGGASVVASCEWDGTVVRWSPGAPALERLAGGLRRPRPVAVVDGAVLVGEYTAGRVALLGLEGPSALALVPAAAPERPALAGMTANLVSAFAVVGRRLAVAYQLVNHTGDESSEAVDDDYGSVSQGNPKINPAVAALERRAGTWSLVPAPVTYAVFDGGERALSGPVALAAAGDGEVLVAHATAARVALVTLVAERPEVRVRRSWVTAPGPFGVAVEGDRAFVDGFLDGATTRLDWRGPGLAAPPVTRVRVDASPLTGQARAGRRLFYDATNPHLTPARVVACATCHPEGGDDGLTWFIGTTRIPDKIRRTPHLRNAGPATLPLHWDGAFPDMPSLVQGTVTDLMGGDGLLIDGALVSAFVAEGIPAPTRSTGDPAAAARGQAVFEAGGCAGCHRPPAYTDGLRHAVLGGAPGAPTTLAQVDTPALNALFLRAPYLHDGSSPTLEHLLDRPDAAGHGVAAALGAAARDDLIAFLESL